MAEIIKARVWTKIDTLDAWDANPLILGAGEFAPVLTAVGGSVFNFKVGTGDRRFSDLPWSLQNPGAAIAADTNTAFPTGVPGLYIPTESGTYEGVTVDLSAGYTQLIWDGTTLVKVEFPIDLSGYLTRAGTSLVVAAHDTPAELKKGADYVGTTSSNSINRINDAIDALPAEGGTILLLPGNYESPGGIEITKNNVEIAGIGYNTRIQAGAGSDVYANSAVTGVRLRNLRIDNYYFEAGSEYKMNECWVGSRYVDNVFKPYDVLVAAFDSPNKENADFIATSTATGIDTINAAIASALPTYGTVQLLPGTYGGSAGVNLSNKDGITLRGAGRRSLIQRDSGADIFINNSNRYGIVIENLRVANQIFVTAGVTNTKAVNCWIGTAAASMTHLNRDYGVNVIKVGKGLDFERLAPAIGSISGQSESNRFVIEVYGEVQETSTVNLNKPHVDIIGYNARVVVPITTNSSGLFISPLANGLIRDIDVIRQGEVDGFIVMAINIESDNVRLFNVRGINEVTVPAEYLPLAPNDEPANMHGDRRYGINILVSDNSNTELHGCVGISSPYGFHNCRGIYIHSGNPKLYDCTGIGGGIGKWGHGILSHRGSKAQLYNCIGIGSPYNIDREESCGIKTQEMSASEFHNCTGIGGQNCVLGHGISAGFNSMPRFFNCVGYPGRNVNGRALQIEWNARPEVYGGYYGVNKKSFTYSFTKDSGEFYMTILPWPEFPYQIINIDATAQNVPAGSKLRVYADGSGGETQIFEQDFSAPYSQGNITLTQAVVESDYTLRAVFVNSGGSEITASDGAVLLHINVIPASTGQYALYLRSPQDVRIYDATFESNSESDCLFIMNEAIDAMKFEFHRVQAIPINTAKYGLNCNKAASGVKIWNSRIEGLVNNVSSWAPQSAIGGSSNYKNS